MKNEIDILIYSLLIFLSFYACVFRCVFVSLVIIVIMGIDLKIKGKGEINARSKV